MKFRISHAAFAAILTAVIAAPAMTMPSPAAAQASGSTTAKEATKKPKRAPTAGQLAARERQKKCAAEWKGAKAAGKTEKGETWPKYWSACNKRLKAAG